ncbi:hypothetical protein FHR94_000431 [Halomonas cerina]|uniref:Uncharacterized protein n=1 Tax=Halomonas cerina TaxID=447424 RepID=A0A839V6N7_9GAMM|nr:hypothetical protein [Halomonas cerina]
MPALISAIPADLFPVDRLAPAGNLQQFLQKLRITDYSGSDYMDPQEGFKMELDFSSEEIFELAGLGGVQLVVGGKHSSVLGVKLKAAFPQRKLDVTLTGKFRIRFPEEWLKPVIKKKGKWTEDGSRQFSEIEVGAKITINQDWNVSFGGPNEFVLQPAMIADTGFVVEAKVALDLSEHQTIPASDNLELPDVRSISPGWQGIVFKELSLHFPDSLKGLPIDELEFHNFHIGTGGISGTIGLNTENYDTDQSVTTSSQTLFGIPFLLTELDVQFVQNTFSKADITGKLRLPFFDQDVEVELGIDLDGNLTAELTGEDGLATVSKDNLFKFEIDSLGFSVEEGVPAVSLGGTLTPTLELLSDAPGVRIDELRIDAEGNVDIQGGWIDLPDQYRAEIAGLGFEITKFGMGYTAAGRKWIGLNGGIELPEGLPAGASVEGLRIFPDGNEPAVTLNGIGVEFTVPETLAFKGEVALKGKEFRGDIDLELMALGLSVDAELVFGTHNRNGNAFQYMAIYLDADLPAGIPLWATGLSLYGFSGLFASQYEPDKSGEQKWYAITGGTQSWYHWKDKGVTDFDKWRPRAGALGFGAGVTVATAADNGLSLANDLLLVIVFPGPILMLQGRSDLLKKGTQVGEDAAFQTLAVLDGRAGSFTLGMDARYKEGEKGRVMDISASAEAFYSLNDPDSWYLNIGKKKPRDQRIRAEALSVFVTEAYFMLDPNRLAMGIWRGYDKEWKYGPLKVILEAWIASDVLVNFEPAHFHGEIRLHGKVALKAFGVGMGLTADTKIAADVFDPFHLLAKLSVSLSTPWPLPDPSAKVTLEWGPQPDPPQLPDVIGQIGIGHKKLASTWQPKPDRLKEQANRNALDPPLAAGPRRAHGTPGCPPGNHLPAAATQRQRRGRQRQSPQPALGAHRRSGKEPGAGTGPLRTDGRAPAAMGRDGPGLDRCSGPLRHLGTPAAPAQAGRTGHPHRQGPEPDPDQTATVGAYPLRLWPPRRWRLGRRHLRPVPAVSLSAGTGVLRLPGAEATRRFQNLFRHRFIVLYLRANPSPALAVADDIRQTGSGMAFRRRCTPKYRTLRGLRTGCLAVSGKATPGHQSHR